MLSAKADLIFSQRNKWNEMRDVYVSEEMAN
jgi:hypothetical protein